MYIVWWETHEYAGAWPDQGNSRTTEKSVQKLTKIAQCLPGFTCFSAASRGLPPANKYIEINHVLGNANVVLIPNIELVSSHRPPKVYQARCDRGINQNNLIKIKTV